MPVNSLTRIREEPFPSVGYDFRVPPLFYRQEKVCSEIEKMGSLRIRLVG